MHLQTLSTLAALPLLALAAHDAPQPTAAPESAIAVSSATQTPSPAPGDAWNSEATNVDLELRQATEQNLAATQAVTQVPATQDYWIADHWDSIQSTEIWVEVKYTQTFQSHPGKWTTAGAGSIGLGTHTGVVGVVKDTKKGAASSVMPQGSLFTAVLGLAGVAAGMGFVLL